jgi:ribosomal protein L7/L12
MPEPTPGEPTPPDPGPSEPTPADDVSPRGLKGWLARRAEAVLSKPRRALPALTQQGEWQVVLQMTGPNPVTVITVITEATGLDFMSASRLAQDAPAVVVSGISEASADLVVERLQKAGAKAVAGERYRPE